MGKSQLIYAQAEVVIDNLQDLVDAIDRTGGWGASEWVALAAAVTSGLFAFLLWRVTRTYTDETKAIAEANQRMAEANDRMVKANIDVLEEMRRDREVMLDEPSRRVAERLQHALADIQRFHFGRADEELRSQLMGVYNNWLAAYTQDAGAIRDSTLRNELARFHGVFGALAIDRDAMVALAEDEERHLAYPVMRLTWLVSNLAAGLGAHRRGEAVEQRMPAAEHAHAFWEVPRLIDRAVWQHKMRDPDYNPAPDVERHWHERARRRDPDARLTRWVPSDDEE